MPDPGPFGDTRFEASDLAIVAASLVKRPSGGWVESVFTFATQRFVFRALFFWAGMQNGPRQLAGLCQLHFPRGLADRFAR